MSHVWGDLPEQAWIAVIADRGHEEGPRIEIVGFDNEESADNFCSQYDSVCYEYAVVTGCLTNSGSVSDGRSYDWHDSEIARLKSALNKIACIQFPSEKGTRKNLCKVFSGVINIARETLLKEDGPRRFKKTTRRF